MGGKSLAHPLLQPTAQTMTWMVMVKVLLAVWLGGGNDGPVVSVSAFFLPVTPHHFSYHHAPYTFLHPSSPTTTTITTTIPTIARTTTASPLSRAARGSVPRTTSTTKTTSLVVLLASPEPLESEGEWTAFLDEETTGFIYYFNTRTGESRWDPPTASFPQVYLTPRKRRLAQRIRDRYQKKQQQQQQQKALLEQQQKQQQQQKIAIPALLETVGSVASKGAATKSESTVSKAKRTEEPNWFASLFDDKPSSSSGGKGNKVEEPDWFVGLFDETAPSIGGALKGAVAKSESTVPIKAKRTEEPNWFASLFDDKPNSSSGGKGSKVEEPDWFVGLFDETAPSIGGALKGAATKSESTVSTKTKRTEEPNWFASLFDDKSNSGSGGKGNKVEEPDSFVGLIDETAPSIAEVGVDEQQQPSWVKDRWVAGQQQQQQQQQTPSTTEPPTGGIAAVPETVEEKEVPKGKKETKPLFGFLKKKDKETPPPVVEEKDVGVNGEVVVAETAPPPPAPAPAVKKVAAKPKKTREIPRPATPAVATTTTTKAPPAPAVVEEAAVTLDMSAYVLPHPARILWGGEDAVFIKGPTFGVFDGVTGAKKLDGVALYSKVMASQMQKLIKDSNSLTLPEIIDSLTKASQVANVKSTGASTAVVASINTERGYLQALNLGDSICMVIRGNKVVARTAEVNHFFECPYQLASGVTDQPRDGSKLTFKLRRGDVIVMGSDGLFDNLSDAEIIRTVTTVRPSRASLLAKRLAEQSRRVSLDPNAITPFAKVAQENGEKDYASGLGGKVDDVSCIVVRYT